MIVMAVVGVALGGGLAGLVAAQFTSIYGSRARDRPARAAGAPSGPNRSPRVMSPDQAVSNITWTPPFASAAVRQPRARERVDVVLFSVFLFSVFFLVFLAPSRG
jgi:hypothetical protein